MRQGTIATEHYGFRFLLDFDRREITGYQMKPWGNFELVYHSPFHVPFDPIKLVSVHQENFLRAYLAVTDVVAEIMKDKKETLG